MKRFPLACICAYVSLAISVILSLLWICNVFEMSVVSLDTFVGVIVALLAIIVTFAIGWQIYNAMEINRRIDQFDDKLRKFQELKTQIDKQQKKIESIRHEAYHFSHMGIADSCMKQKDFIGAFRFYLSALTHSLTMEVPINQIQMMDASLKAIDSVPSSQKLLCRLYNEIEGMDVKIRKSKFYPTIQDKYEKAYAMFKQKVVSEPNL